MYVCTIWKLRALTPEQGNRMMATWGKLEASLASSPAGDRVCWFINSDGTGGVTVAKVKDPDAFAVLELEQSLALGEFLEFTSNIVLDLDSAMPGILKGMEHVNAK